MPAKFHQFAPTVWDRTMRRLSCPATLVRLYVMTCSNRVSEGLFQLPLGIIVHDTGLSEEQVVEGLAELEEAGLVSYDEDAEVVLDRTALKYAPLKHGRDTETGEVKRNRAMVSAVKLFGTVPETPLKREAYRLAKRYASDFARELVLAFPDLGHDDLEDGDLPFAPTSIDPPAMGDRRGIDGGSRGEASREESSRGDAPACEGCGESAHYELGELQVDLAGKPWCTYCKGTDLEGGAA